MLRNFPNISKKTKKSKKRFERNKSKRENALSLSFKDKVVSFVLEVRKEITGEMILGVILAIIIWLMLS
jgi:hypothetical protein